MDKKFNLILHDCKSGDEKQRSFDMGNQKPVYALIEQLIRHFNAEHATIEEKYVPKKNTGGWYIFSDAIVGKIAAAESKITI